MRGISGRSIKIDVAVWGSRCSSDTIMSVGLEQSGGQVPAVGIYTIMLLRSM